MISYDNAVGLDTIAPPGSATMTTRHLNPTRTDTLVRSMHAMTSPAEDVTGLIERGRGRLLANPHSRIPEVTRTLRRRAIIIFAALTVIGLIISLPTSH